MNGNGTMNRILGANGVLFDRTSPADLPYPKTGRLAYAQDTTGARVRSKLNADLNRFLQSFTWTGKGKIPYRTMLEMSNHPVIAMATAAVTHPLRALGYEIQCRREDVRAFVDAVISGIWVRLKEIAFGNGVPYGWAPMEKVFEVMDLEAEPRLSSASQEIRQKSIQFTQRWVLTKLVALCPDPLITQPVIDEKASFGGLENRPPSTGLDASEWTRLPPEKVFVFTPDKLSGSLLGKGVYVNAYRSWMRDRILWHLWMMHLERRGIPQAKGRAPVEEREDPFTGAKRSGMAILQDLLTSAIHGEPFILPDEVNEISKLQAWDVELMSTDPRGDLFERAVGQGELAMVHGILRGPAKTVLQGTGRTGTFAETREHSDLYWNCLQTLADSFEDDANAHLIPQIVDLNFTGAPPCRLKLERVRSLDRDFLQKIAPDVMKARTIVGGKIVTPAGLVDPVKLFNTAGIPLNLAVLSAKSGESLDGGLEPKPEAAAEPKKATE